MWEGNLLIALYMLFPYSLLTPSKMIGIWEVRVITSSQS